MIKSLFQALGCTFHSLGRTFQTLEYTFQTLEQNLLHRERTFLPQCYNNLSTMFQHLYKCWSKYMKN